MVSFFAKRAEGAGYSGRARYFSLETSTNIGSATWQPVANFTNIFGNNQTVIYATASTNGIPRMFRSKVVLQ